jgi:GrpB-like predicted nucleotidyltransferase (UPF0157 family)
MASPVVVLQYDPAWVRVFEEIRDFVSPVLGDLAVAIEHVGSTSVPGLASKPIVDMDIVVSSQTDIQTAIQNLSTLGYVHEGDLGAKGREAFIPPVTKTWHHLYVCTVDNEEYKRHILFRDYLQLNYEVHTPLNCLVITDKSFLNGAEYGSIRGVTVPKDDIVNEIRQKTKMFLEEIKQINPSILKLKFLSRLCD